MIDSFDLKDLVYKAEKKIGKTVKCIMKLNADDIVLFLDTETIPGLAYKINMKTKDVSYYLPSNDIDEFFEACEKDPIYLND